MILLIYGNLKKTQPPSEYNKKETGTDLGNQLVITNGERQEQGTF